MTLLQLCAMETSLNYYSPPSQKPRYQAVANLWLAATGGVHFLLGIIVLGLAYFFDRIPGDAFPLHTLLKMLALGSFMLFPGFLFMVVAPRLPGLSWPWLATVQFAVALHGLALLAMAVLYHPLGPAVPLFLAPLFALSIASACALQILREAP